MAEEGIDIAGNTPKVLTVDAVKESDVVITMGCGDVCPIFPGKRYEDWVLDDPAGQGIDAVRPIRDEIRRRVEALLVDLAPGQGCSRDQHQSDARVTSGGRSRHRCSRAFCSARAAGQSATDSGDGGWNLSGTVACGRVLDGRPAHEGRRVNFRRESSRMFRSPRPARPSGFTCVLRRLRTSRTRPVRSRTKRPPKCADAGIEFTEIMVANDGLRSL